MKIYRVVPNQNELTYIILTVTYVYIHLRTKRGKLRREDHNINVTVFFRLLIFLLSSIKSNCTFG